MKAAAFASSFSMSIFSALRLTSKNVAVSSSSFSATMSIFVLTLAVPPASDTRIDLPFYQYTLKVTFKHQTAESFIIPTYNHLHTSIVLYLQHIAVLVDEAEPEREKIILDDIPDILGGTLLEQRLLLRYDFVFFFQLGKITADFLAYTFSISERDVFPRAIGR